MQSLRDIPFVRALARKVDHMSQVSLCIDPHMRDGEFSRPAVFLSASDCWMIHHFGHRRLCLVSDFRDVVALLWVLTQTTTHTAVVEVRSYRKLIAPDVTTLHDDLVQFLDGQVAPNAKGDTARHEEMLRALDLVHSSHGRAALSQRLAGLADNPGVFTFIEALKPQARG